MAYPIWHVEGTQERQVSDTDLQKYLCYQDSPNHGIVELVEGCPFYPYRMVPSQKVIDVDISDLRESDLFYERHRELAGYFSATLALLTQKFIADSTPKEITR